MLKNKVALEVVVGDRKYELQMSNESPLGEVYDVLTSMRGYVFNMISEEEKKAASKKSEKADEKCEECCDEHSQCEE